MQLLISILGTLALCVVGDFYRSSQTSLPPPPDSKLVWLTSGAGYSEPSIAVDPASPQRLVAAYQVGASVMYSIDGGVTWKKASGTAPSNYRVSGDVSITFDAKGNVILCYIAFDQLGVSSNYWGYKAYRNGIFTRLSMDGGKTWASNHVPVIEHPRTEPNIPFEDKPYIIADNSNGPYRGNLYVGWTQFTLNCSIIIFSRSVDGGKSWSSPITISSFSGNPRDDNGNLEGFYGAVGSDSTLYVVWADRLKGIAFAKSTDGGKSFTASKDAFSTDPLYFNLQDFDRANGFPQIAVVPHKKRNELQKFKNASGKDALFISWSDFRNGDTDIFVSSSVDDGLTWSQAIRVNDDAIHNGKDQFFQWMTTDPTTGDIYLAYYDRRDDTYNEKSYLVLARSTDGGHIFTNYQWSTSFDPSGYFLGDYIGLTVFGGKVWGVWTEYGNYNVSDSEDNSEDIDEWEEIIEKRNIKDDQRKDDVIKEENEERKGTAIRLGIANFNK